MANINPTHQKTVISPSAEHNPVDARACRAMANHHSVMWDTSTSNSSGTQTIWQNYSNISITEARHVVDELNNVPVRSPTSQFSMSEIASDTEPLTLQRYSISGSSDQSSVYPSTYGEPGKLHCIISNKYPTGGIYINQNTTYQSTSPPPNNWVQLINNSDICGMGGAGSAGVTSESHMWQWATWAQYGYSGLYIQNVFTSPFLRVTGTGSISGGGGGGEGGTTWRHYSHPGDPYYGTQWVGYGGGGGGGASSRQPGAGGAAAPAISGSFSEYPHKHYGSLGSAGSAGTSSSGGAGGNRGSTGEGGLGSYSGIQGHAIGANGGAGGGLGSSGVYSSSTESNRARFYYTGGWSSSGHASPHTGSGNAGKAVNGYQQVISITQDGGLVGPLYNN